MEFGKHLGTGLWGIADKSLAVVYGIGFVLLVIRVLPEEQLGNFILLQELFLIISGLANALALQPLLKYSAEDTADYRSVVGASLLLNLAFVLLSAVLVVVFRQVVSDVLNAPALANLLLFMPALLGASFIRNFTLILLQSKLQMKPLFWTDAAHFLGATGLVYVFSKFNAFSDARDLVTINLISLSSSSIFGLWAARRLIQIRWMPERSELKRVWDYGKYSLGGIVSYLFYSRADSFVLSAVMGPVQVAVYNSVKIFTRIYDMTTQVLQMFVLPVVSRLSARGEFAKLKALVEKSIAFSTIGLIPVLLGFLLFAPTLIAIVYQGRYTEAIPLLRVFSLLSLVIPAIAVSTNTLMGLGQARTGFTISVQILVVSVVLYVALTPLLGPMGTTAGYVASSFVLAWLTMAKMNMNVPVRLSDILRRTNDVTVFLKSRLGGG